MIDQAVEELTPLVGTRPACRALGGRAGDPTGTGARPRPAEATAVGTDTGAV